MTLFFFFSGNMHCQIFDKKMCAAVTQCKFNLLCMQGGGTPGAYCCREAVVLRWFLTNENFPTLLSAAFFYSGGHNAVWCLRDLVQQNVLFPVPGFQFR